MASFLYQFFHNETNDRSGKGLVQIPKNEEEWPEEWKRVEYKRYPLFKPIPLPRMETPLFALLSKRRSNRSAVLANRVSLSILSQILRSGYGLQASDPNGPATERRTVPSAGKRYPLEVYLFLFRDVEGCAKGIYHYGVRQHVLEPVTLDTPTHDELLSYVHQEWLADANGMICLSAVFGRTTDKYGSRGYRYILLEAGHVAQNMLLAGAENQINLVPIGGANEADMEKKIGLNDSSERIVYTIFF